jgi:hypothetical protein
MMHISGDTYELTIGPYENATEISFWVIAKDTSYDKNAGVNENDDNNYNIQVFVEPKSAPEPPPPKPEPTPEPQGEIPGFPTGSIVIGLALAVTILRMFQVFYAKS